MRLFTLNELYEVEISPEAFLIEGFSDLLADRKKKSKTKSTDLAIKELAYIYFFYDLKSDFISIMDLRERKATVIKQVGLPEDWKPDDLVNKAIASYRDLMATPSSKLLESVYIGVGKIEKHLRTIDLNATKSNGDLVHNSKSILDMIKNVPDVLKSIKRAEEEYLKDEEISDKLRGDKIKTLYEDGFRGV